MSDIVERLRERRREEIVYNDYEPIEELVDLLKDAADEIERLRAELEAERKKHEWISVKDNGNEKTE